MTRTRSVAVYSWVVVLTIAETLMFAAVAALHWRMRALGFDLVFPLALVESVLALALGLAVLIPGSRGIRAGRVMAAQILAFLGLIVIHVAIAFDLALASWRTELLYGFAAAAALACVTLLALPALRPRAPRAT